MNETPPDINPSSPGNKTRRVSIPVYKTNTEVLPTFLDSYNNVIAEQTLGREKSSRSVLSLGTSTKSLNITNSSSSNSFVSSIVPPGITKNTQPPQLSHKSKVVDEARPAQLANLTQSTSSGDNFGLCELLETKEKPKYSNLRDSNKVYPIRSAFSSTPIADKYTGSAQFSESFYSNTPRKTRSPSGEKLFIITNFC